MLDPGTPLLGPWDFFAKCPFCRREGERIDVKLTNQHQTFTYRCRECEHEWPVIGPHQEPSPRSRTTDHPPPSPSTDAK